MQKFDAYIVSFLMPSYRGIENDEQIIHTDDYEEAFKVFNQCKRNKKYEAKRKWGNSLVLNGYNEEDCYLTRIKEIDLRELREG